MTKMIYHEQIKWNTETLTEEEVCPDEPQKSEDDPDNEESTDDTEKEWTIEKKREQLGSKIVEGKCQGKWEKWVYYQQIW